jgi:tripeptidyl-peptidase-1
MCVETKYVHEYVHLYTLYTLSHQAVTGFLDQFIRNDDLQTFYTKEYPIAVGRTMYKILGPNPSSSKAGVESSLDVQYLTSIGGNIPSEFWSFPGTAPDNPENEPFLDFMYLLGNTTDVPMVFSTSYGEDEDSTSMGYATRLNSEFVKAGSRGITLLFASGDDGTYCVCVCVCCMYVCEKNTLLVFDVCVVVGVSQQNNPAFCKTFAGKWPAGSPYVTAVGGTNTKTGESGSEVAWQHSSGGFSNRWPRKEWQKDAVDAFFKNSDPKNLPDPNVYNSTGQGFPDIAAMGQNFAIVVDGRPMQVSGTSCSSPTVAGIIALLNEKDPSKPLGFLNPLIYSSSSPFFDITSGNNPGCGSGGFFATEGWDPVTGWGSVNYEKWSSSN